MIKNIIVLVFLICLSCTTIEASLQSAVELSPTDVDHVKHYVQLAQQDIPRDAEEDSPVCDFYLKDSSTRAGSICYSSTENRVFVAFKDLSQSFDLGALASVSFDEIKGNLYSMYRDLFYQSQQSLMERIQRLLSLQDSNPSFTFCGYGAGGAVATVAAADFLDRHPTLRDKQVHLVTFSAPVVGDRDFIDSFHNRIHIENAINFDLSVRHALFSSDTKPVGIQAQVLLSEQIEDVGFKRFFACALPLKRSQGVQIFLPSLHALRKVVAHYQLGYRALRANLDHCPRIEDIGRVSEFSTSRGVWSLFYKIL